MAWLPELPCLRPKSLFLCSCIMHLHYVTLSVLACTRGEQVGELGCGVSPGAPLPSS